MLFAAFLLVVVGWGLYVLIFRVSEKRQRLLALAAQVPTYKGALPFVGHACKFIGGTDGLWAEFQNIGECVEDAGGVMKLWIGSTPVFVVSDPDAALTVANSCLKKSSYFYKVDEPCCGNGLLVADVTNWKRNRKLLNPTFSQQVLDGFLHIFNEQSQLLAQHLESFAGKGKLDPEELLTNNMLETTCKTILGITLDDTSVIDQKYKKAIDTALHAVIERLCRVWLLNDFMYQLSSLKKREDEALSTMYDMSKKVIAKRKAEKNKEIVVETSSSRFKPFLDLMLDLVEEGLFIDEHMIHEMNMMIAASYDTTSKAMNSILVLLGSHPEVQEKMYNEIKSVVGSKDVVEREDLKKLVYTEVVIKEALRVSPVVPVIARDVEKEVKLKNCTLPEGSVCIIFIWGIHRLPIWGPDRYKFRPERWLDPASLPQSAGAFCAFSIGRRNCLGKTYALMSLKTTLAHLIRKFKITADYSKVKRKFAFVLEFMEGQHVSLELREQC